MATEETSRFGKICSEFGNRSKGNDLLWIPALDVKVIMHAIHKETTHEEDDCKVCNICSFVFRGKRGRWQFNRSA